jgi:hypothetical protein
MHGLIITLSEDDMDVEAEPHINTCFADSASEHTVPSTISQGQPYFPYVHPVSQI